jgi:hypothetical protein
VILMKKSTLLVVLSCMASAYAAVVNTSFQTSFTDTVVVGTSAQSEVVRLSGNSSS